MANDYPIIEADTRLRFEESGDNLVILQLWVDEDGITQVLVNDNFQEKRTLTVEDIHERIDREGGCERLESLRFEEPPR